MTSRSATKGFFWKSLEQYGIMGIQFVLQLVLARILDPAAYSDLAIILIIISFANVFVQSGFGTALIQKKDLSQKDISSIFVFSTGVAIIIYILIFFASPFIADFFNRPSLTPYIRVLSLILFPYSYNAIQNSILRKELKFKELFIYSIVSLLLSGIIGIIFALRGFGVWALIIQQFSYCVLISISLSFIVKWKPKLEISFYCLKPLLRFGWKVFLTSLIDDIYANLRTIVIGKFYDANSLAFFNRGRSFPNMLVKSINGSFQSVLLPVMSKNQDNAKENVRVLSNTIKVCSFLLFPALAVLAGCAESLVSVLITDKWLPCVPYLQVFCIFFLSWPISSSNVQALLAVGKSGLVLKLEVARKIIDTVVLAISMSFGPIGIAWGASIVGLMSILLYLMSAQRYVNYKISSQIKDILPGFTLSFVVFLGLQLLNCLSVSPFILLPIQVFCGLIVYFGAAYLFKFDGLSISLNYFKILLKK